MNLLTFLYYPITDFNLIYFIQREERMTKRRRRSEMHFHILYANVIRYSTLFIFNGTFFICLNAKYIKWRKLKMKHCFEYINIKIIWKFLVSGGVPGRSSQVRPSGSPTRPSQFNLRPPIRSEQSTLPRRINASKMCSKCFSSPLERWSWKRSTKTSSTHR